MYRRFLPAENRHWLKKLKENPTSFHYPKIKPPYVRTIRLRKSGNKPAYTATVKRDSLIELMNVPFEKNEA